ncbi:SCO family protein [Rhizobium sp. PAMB 3174]
MTWNPGLSALCLIAALTAYPADAHDGSQGHHSVQDVIFAEEELALPNLPVTDRSGGRGGFRDKVGTDHSIIMSFSYTECESLCNMTNAYLAVVDDYLSKTSDDDVRIVTVAIDAVRDTPESLNAEAEAFNASAKWLWLTGGEKGTRPLLETLRFPPGALEDHDPIFLVGRPCRGLFTRIVGIPDPDRLFELARSQPACAD